ncbi:MAG: DUF4274 domain-containing protein [Hyphomonadaceae bacterium]|nr:DUF4274 domain-containing protein [Hyphomonadaceae bacterium]
MFAKLMSRLVPLPASAHDHLFTTFAPEGAPPQVLNTIYHQYRGAMPDEPVPPQHAHFRLMVDRIIGANWRRLDGIELRRVSSAYVCCFERAEAFEFQLALWRVDPDFRRLLIETRERLIAELIPLAAAESARRFHFSRWQECRAAPLDITAPTLSALIQKMDPDDWHEIVLHWDWSPGVDELEWITAQRTCDRATALFALCSGAPGEVATRHERRGGDHAGFVRDLAARIEGGFYPVADLGLSLSMRQLDAFEAELGAARATGMSPWRIPADLLGHQGKRAHAPKYAVTNRRAHYQYEWWLKHMAPPPAKKFNRT